MARLSQQAESLYGTPLGLARQNPFPIIAKRDPSTLDTGYAIGQTWINNVAGTWFGLARVSAGVATWVSFGTTTGSFATVTAGDFITSTAATEVTWNAGNVWTATGTDADIGFTFTPKGTGGFTLTTGDLTVTNGNLVLGTAGNGISIKAGADARIGQATLVLGTVSVANTSVTANTRVLVTRSSINASVALGVLEAVPTAGVGFVITSYDLTAGVETDDVSIVDWMLVESA